MIMRIGCVKMGSLEYSGLLYPTLEGRNEKGVFFRMKRKDEWGPTYYVFEKNMELLSKDEKKEFDEVWKLITDYAGKSGINLYDNAEIMEAVQSQMTKVMKSEDAKRALKKANEIGAVEIEDRVLVRDIEIRLFDHGTGRINSLTIGISVLAGSRAPGSTENTPQSAI